MNSREIKHGIWMYLDSFLDIFRVYADTLQFMDQNIDLYNED